MMVVNLKANRGTRSCCIEID